MAIVVKHSGNAAPARTPILNSLIIFLTHPAQIRYGTGWVKLPPLVADYNQHTIAYKIPWASVPNGFRYAVEIDQNKAKSAVSSYPGPGGAGGAPVTYCEVDDVRLKITYK